MGSQGYLTPPDRRLTLGFLTFYQNKMMQGVFDAARKYDTNIICFFYNLETSGQNYDVNAFIKLIKDQNLDGLLFLGWMQIAGVNVEAFRHYFSPLPLFSLGGGHKDIPCVYMDGTVYLRQLLIHLIEVHGCRRIAFSAPILWDERVTTYVEVMKEYNIYDPQLLIDSDSLKPAGFDLERRARLIIRILIDERKISFDAISSLYSDESVYILSILKARGFRIPEDVKIIGNEDKENEKYSSPPLTTIHYPFWDIGYYGCERFIEMLTFPHKDNIPFNTIIPGKSIYRESCGCIPQSLKIINQIYAATGKTMVPLSPDPESVRDKLKSMLPDTRYELQELLNAFFSSFAAKDYRLFLNMLIKQIHALVSNPEDSTGIEDFISCLHNILLPGLCREKDDLIWIENLFHQSRIILKEQMLNIMGEERISCKQINQALQAFSQEMLIPFDLKELMDALANNFPHIDIPSCYLFLDRGKEPAREYTLVFEYVSGQRIIPPTALFSSSRDLPLHLLPKNRRYTFLCLLLGVEDEHLGFVLFEPGPLIESIYRTITIQLSTTIKGIILLEKLENVNLELKMIQEELVDKAHQAGMADIATGTLHNVGNILNSINASTQIMHEILNNSPLGDFKQANGLLEEKITDLTSFICDDPKGKKLIHLYLKLHSSFSLVQKNLQNHLNRLNEKTKLVNEIIIAQQTYANAKPILEKMDLEEIIEDTLKMQSTILEKYHIEIVRNFHPIPKIMAQKTKLFHILINLFNNARDAMQNIPEENRKLILTLRKNTLIAEILIEDTGIGIPPELLPEIFTSGFTTKKEGHGFGLHSCANYMAEMGGKFRAESPGMGKGATFILGFNLDEKG